MFLKKIIMETLPVVDQELLGSMAIAQCTIFEPDGNKEVSEPIFIRPNPPRGEWSPLNSIAVFFTSGGFAFTSQDFLSDRRPVPYTQDELQDFLAEIFIDDEGQVVIRSPLALSTTLRFPPQHSKVYIFETFDRRKCQIIVSVCSEAHEGIAFLNQVQVQLQRCN